MAKIKALMVHPVMEGVEVWEQGTAQLPLQQALEGELVSLEGAVALSRGRPGRWGRRGVRELRLASLDLEGLGRIRGVVVSRSATRLTRYLLRAARPTRRTVLATWLQERELNEASMAELGELLEQAWLLGRDVEGSPLSRRLPKGGLALLPDSAELSLAKVSIDGHDWWMNRIREPHTVCAVVQDRILTIGGHRIPQPLQIRRHGPMPLYAWYDGLRHGHASSLEALPPSMLERMDERGWMRSVTEPLRPLTDLELRFLVRRPSRNERPRHAASSVPPGCEHPAILMRSSEPVPLVGPGGRPLDVPIVDDPAEALAVLGRAYDSRIYVPHAPCLPPDEVPGRASRSEWLLGVLPSCLAT
jgi:hypothetical protein